MITTYKRIIGLLMVLPGLELLYLSYTNRAYDIMLSQIVVFVTGALISVVIILFFYGIWLLVVGPED